MSLLDAIDTALPFDLIRSVVGLTIRIHQLAILIGGHNSIMSEFYHLYRMNAHCISQRAGDSGGYHTPLDIVLSMNSGPLSANADALLGVMFCCLQI